MNEPITTSILPTPSSAGPSSGLLIDVRGLRAGYRDIEVVHGIDLQVRPGEIVALLGPNGAGKSTTLATIAGLLPILAGEVDVLATTHARTRRRTGASVAIQSRRSGLAFVPEDRALFFGLTAREHLRLAAPKGDRSAIDDALAPFPALQAIVDRKAGSMSGGEQQMLAVARALAARPKVLMIDELSLGLAPIIVERLLPMVRAVCDTSGVGVLLVEQHVNAALAIADRAHVMVRGAITLSGPADAMQRDPNSLAAAYLGTNEPETLHP